MDPCPFVRFLVGNLALTLPETPSRLSSSSAFYCRFKLRGIPSQISDIKVVAAGGEAVVENRVHVCFSLSKAEVERLIEKSGKARSELKIDIRIAGSSLGCGGFRSGRLIGCVVVQLDLKNVMENWGINKATVIQNGWVAFGGSGSKLHLTVRAEPDPRFVFRFDGEPECSPQVFQVNGNVQQPVFSCKFAFRNSGEWGSRSRSPASEPSTSSVVSCFRSPIGEEQQKPLKERKGWSITIHDLSGSPVAAASILTPFVPSEGSDCVTKSNPGAWLILRPGYGTWKPWARLEAWRERRGIGRNSLGYRFDLIPDGGGVDTISLASSTIDAKSGGKFSVDITTGPSLMTSPNGSFDFGSSSGSGSSSDLGSASGSGSWGHLLYGGFVMSSTVGGDGKCSKPEVEVGAQHVSCTEDAAAFVALSAALDLSVDACGPFSRSLRKELRQQAA